MGLLSQGCFSPKLTLSPLLPSSGDCFVLLQTGGRRHEHHNATVCIRGGKGFKSFTYPLFHAGLGGAPAGTLACAVSLNVAFGVEDFISKHSLSLNQI